MWAAEFCTRERFVWETKEERVCNSPGGRDGAVDRKGCPVGVRLHGSAGQLNRLKYAGDTGEATCALLTVGGALGVGLPLFFGATRVVTAECCFQIFG